MPVVMFRSGAARRGDRHAPRVVLGLALGGILTAVAGLVLAAAERGPQGPSSGDQTGVEQPKKETKKETKAPPAKTAAQPKPDAKTAAGKGQPPPPPLKFTDEDLQKYHRQPPAAEETGKDTESGPTTEEGVEEPGSEKPAMPAPAATTGTPPGTTPQPPAPGADPLKDFKEREAKEKARAEQIQVLRDRVAQMQSRLDYLRQKRLAILDPLRVMPQAPSPDDRKNDAGLGARELLSTVEQEIKTLEGQVAEAQAELIAVEIRFGTGSDNR